MTLERAEFGNPVLKFPACLCFSSSCLLADRGRRFSMHHTGAPPSCGILKGHPKWALSEVQLEDIVPWDPER